jgi:putative ABC transport system ATP-binding protein
MKLLSVQRVQNYGVVEFPNNFSLVRDSISGLEIKNHTFIGVVCDNSLTADELVDRLGGYLDSDAVTVDGLTFETISRDGLRSNIYAQEKEPAILSGTIESLFQVANSGRISMSEAIASASAVDILDSLEGDGYSAEVVERGRTLSGGQRQRLALARTLFVDAPVVVLDDPTSAVDAHTEARIAQRLKSIREGRTTVVFTNSPLLLDHTNEVALVVNGKVRTTGNHFELLKTNNEYRRLVVRGE